MPIVFQHGTARNIAETSVASGAAVGRSQLQSEKRQQDMTFILQDQASRNQVLEMEAAARLRGDDDQPIHTDERATGVQRFVKAKVAKRAVTSQDDANAQMIGALDQAYQGRQKDASYYYAQRQIESGGTLDAATRGALGIKTEAEELARDKFDAEQIEGAGIESYEPKTAKERNLQQAIQSGRDVPSIIARLEETDIRKRLPGKKRRPASDDAISAQNNLSFALDAMTDPDLIAAMREEYRKNGASQSTLDLFEPRIEELIESKAKIAYPTVRNLTAAMTNRAIQVRSKALGRPLTDEEEMDIEAEKLVINLEAYGISMEIYEEMSDADQAKLSKAKGLTDAVLAAQQQEEEDLITKNANLAAQDADQTAEEHAAKEADAARRLSRPGITNDILGFN